MNILGSGIRQSVPEPKKQLTKTAIKNLKNRYNAFIAPTPPKAPPSSEEKLKFIGKEINDFFL